MTPAAILAVLAVGGPPTTVVPAPAEEAAAPPRRRTPNVVVPAVHGLALMTVMRATETYLWPIPFAEPENFAANWREAFTKPPIFEADRPFLRWDGDSLFINVVGHGLFGSELYLRARQCRFGWGGSLAFAAATSALWEYGFEANGVRPSAQDLVYTPLVGLGLGELRYQLHQVAGKIASPAGRGVLRAVVDPFGELERAAGTDC